MTSLFRNNYVRIGIISFFLVSFVVCFVGPSVALANHSSNHISAPAQAGGQANVAPASTNSGSIFTSIGQFIGNLILGIASMITYFGGMLLEGSIQRFVLELGGPKMLGGSIGVVINNLWVVIRDMANLAFIFGFIYIGIMTIIDSGSAQTKRMLASIIIGALLINFSLFFTKIIIDISNYTAVEIYNALIVPPGGGAPGKISEKMTDIMGLTTLYKMPTADQYAGVTGYGNVAFYFMGAVMLIVAGFVFAAGAILLIIRFVALVFIMIFSPLLFAATVFPQTQSTASDLWKKLISYSFFAPAYLILLVVSVNILAAFTAIFRNPANGASDALVGRAGAFDVIINFVVAILFLIMSLQIAQKFGVAGANKVMSVGNSLRGKVQSAVGRNTVGVASKYALKGYDKLDSKIANSARMQKIKSTKLGRFGVGAAKVAAFGATGGLVGGVINDRNVRGTLEAGKKAKFGGDYSHADDKSYDEERKKRQATTNQTAAFEKALKDGTAAGATDKDKIAMEKAVAGASVKFLEELKHEMREAVIDNMSQSQFEGLQKSDKLSDEEKSALTRARQSRVEQRLTAPPLGSPAGTPPVPLANVIAKASAKDLDNLDYNTVLANAGRLTSKQLDDMTLTPTAKTRLKGKRETDLVDEFNTGGPGRGAATLFGRIKSEAEIAKLPRTILTEPESAPYLTQQVLTKMLDNESILPTDRANIRTNVENAYLANPALQAKYIDFFDNTPAGKQYL